MRTSLEKKRDETLTLWKKATRTLEKGEKYYGKKSQRIEQLMVINGHLCSNKNRFAGTQMVMKTLTTECADKSEFSFIYGFLEQIGCDVSDFPLPY